MKNRITLFLRVVIMSGLLMQAKAMETADIASDITSGLSRLSLIDTSDSAPSSAASSMHTTPETTPDPKMFDMLKWRNAEAEDDDSSELSISEDDGEEEKDSASTFEVQVSKVLGVTPEKIPVSKKKIQSISAGEHLYWSLVALVRPQDEHLYVIWLHQKWGTQGFMFHQGGAIGSSTTSNILKKFDVGVKEADAQYGLSVLDAALIMALWHRDLVIMRVLINAGAKLYSGNKGFQNCLRRDYDDGQTVLHRAASEGEADVFFVVLAAIDDLAAQKVPKNLEDASAIIAAKTSCLMPDEESRSPLHHLCMSLKGLLTGEECRAMGLALMQRGAVCTFEDETDTTPMQYAYASGKTELIALFESVTRK